METLSVCIRVPSLLLIAVLCSLCARADVGIIVYESKGADARRTSTGHLALITTRLCPAGIDRLRDCHPGEEPGAILTRYSNVASGYDSSLFVVPIRDHLTATGDPNLVPTLSSGGTLEAMQMEYWRAHLRPYLPALSQEQYELMRDKLKHFDAGRTIRRAITMEYLVALLGPHKKRYATEPIAMIHPVTSELIPDGRWRESVGVQHMRSSVIITASTSLEQEQRLVRLAAETGPQQFNALSNNCSDFVARGLIAVFGDSGFRMRPRALHVADAWITTPIAVATDFVAYAKRQKVPLHIQSMPMLAGTRRPTAAITSISRGALVPDASQGKMAFSMKIYFNILNPLLGVFAFGADKASRFVDLQDLVHKGGSEQLSRIAHAATVKPGSVSRDAIQRQREQVRVFGTPSCWKAKREQFARLEAQATELGLISPVERFLLLKPGQPFLLPRLYERMAALRGSEGVLMAGMQDCTLPSCGSSVVSSVLPAAGGAKLDSESSGSPFGFVSGRPEIRAMAESGEQRRQVIAFKVMTSVVNYDLSSAPVTRRTSEDFDLDWQLYLEVARRNGVHLTDGDVAPEFVAACSCREFDAGLMKIDAFQQDRSLKQTLVREGLGLLYGANR